MGVLGFRGQHLRSLKAPWQSGIVNSIAWEGFGLRIVLTIDSNIFVIIRSTSISTRKSCHQNMYQLKRNIIFTIKCAKINKNEEDVI